MITFSKKNVQFLAAEKEQSSINLISLGTEIGGSLTCKGDVRIDGRIAGSVLSMAKLVLGQSGEIQGNVESVNAEISGKVTGDVLVQDVLFLRETAVVKGDIKAKKIVVESGASFEGSCQIGIGAVAEQTVAPINAKAKEPKNEREDISEMEEAPVQKNDIGSIFRQLEQNLKKDSDAVVSPQTR